MPREKKLPIWPTEQRSRGQLNRVVRAWKSLSETERRYMEYRVTYAVASGRYWQLVEPELMAVCIIGGEGEGVVEKKLNFGLWVVPLLAASAATPADDPPATLR